MQGGLIRSLKGHSGELAEKDQTLNGSKIRNKPQFDFLIIYRLLSNVRTIRIFVAKQLFDITKYIGQY